MLQMGDIISVGGRSRCCGKGECRSCSQKGLADLLQLAGLDLDKNAVQRIESGQRFVTDIELKILAQVLDTEVDRLLGE